MSSETFFFRFNIFEESVSRTFLKLSVCVLVVFFLSVTQIHQIFIKFTVQITYLHRITDAITILDNFKNLF